MLVKYYIDNVHYSDSDSHFDGLRENSIIYINDVKFIVNDINMCMYSLFGSRNLQSYFEVHIMPV